MRAPQAPTVLSTSTSTNTANTRGGALSSSYFSTPSQQQQQQQTGGSNSIEEVQDSRILFNHATFPQGSATALPALPVDDPTMIQNVDTIRERQASVTDGFGDPVHLGGYKATYDSSGLSPAVYRYLISNVGIKSIVDLGCGLGHTISWFVYHGVAHATCVEGSPSAISKSILQNTQVQAKATQYASVSSSLFSSLWQSSTTPNLLVEHDFTRGPWWPEHTVDLVWANAFVQQVSLPYMTNYFAAMSKAAIICMTVPQYAGWHHVEIHSTQWWIDRMERFGGFVFDSSLTDQLQKVARNESSWDHEAPNGRTYDAELIRRSLLVFTNPRVMTLPSHAHLFPEFGCYKGKDHETGQLILRECGILAGKDTETPLAESFYPLTITHHMDREWERMVAEQLGVELREEDEDDAKAPSQSTESILSEKLPPGPKVDLASHGVYQVKHEVLEKGNVTNLPQIPVVVWPYWEFGVGNAESLQIEENGVYESPFLKLSHDMYNFDPNVVWVGDTG